MSCHFKKRKVISLLLLLALLIFVAFQLCLLSRSYGARRQQHVASGDVLFRYTRTPNVSFSCPRLLLLIFSAPHETERRAAIRATWANDSRLDTAGAARVFVIGGQTGGQVLRDEQKEFGDILSDGALTDNYNNLTRKIVSALYWASVQPWQKLRYIVKIDSDNFVNLDVLRRVADRAWRSHGSVWMTGYIIWGKEPYRQKGHKWYVSKEDYPDTYYPSYLNGPHYAMTLESAQRVASNQTLLEIANRRALRMEDVYITGIVRKRLSIPLVYKNAPFFIPHYSLSVSKLLKKDKTVFAAFHGLRKIGDYAQFQMAVDDPEVHLVYYKFLKKKNSL